MLIAQNRQNIARGVAGPHEISTGNTLVAAYIDLLILYLLCLLYLYPYGVGLAPEVSFRLPDFVAFLCVFVGASAVALRGQIRPDAAFLASVGPFVLLEFATPFLGAIGYQDWTAAASGLRMAVLWLPMIFLVMIGGPLHQQRFERKLTSVLIVSLWLNILYAFIQIAVDLGQLPRSLLITEWLEPWAVDPHFTLIYDLRPPGFFATTTALSVFGIVSLCFFYARYVGAGRRQDLFYSMLSLLIIVLTTSRTAVAAAILITAVGWWTLSLRRKAIVGLLLAMGCSSLLILIEKTVGIGEAFHRFQRLLDSGILQDVSFGARVHSIWPAALDAASQYTFGTLVSAPSVVELIDSGYLTYYIQAKWLFVAALVAFIGGVWARGLYGVLNMHRTSGFLLLFLAIYISSAMVISNPLRAPVVIFFLVYAFWMAKCEGEERLFRVRGPLRSGHDDAA